MTRQRRATARLVCVGIAVLLAGCQAPGCPLPGQTSTISLKLYFGRDIQGGGFVTDRAWADFATTVLTPAFPDGFTAYEAQGQWRNPQDGAVMREPSFVVEAVGPISAPKIAGVVAAYRTQFHQLSVGQITQQVCAAF